MHTILAWIESHPGTAAWVQALGTLLALFVAVGVPAYQHSVARRDVERERKARARSLLMLIDPDLMAIRAQTEAMQNRLTSPIPQGPYLPAYWLLQNLNFDVPPLIRERLDSLYLFGEPAGLTLQRLVSAAVQLQGMIVEVRQTFLGNPSATVPQVQAMFGGHLGVITELLDEAEKELESFHVGVAAAISELQRTSQQTTNTETDKAKWTGTTASKSL